MSGSTKTPKMPEKKEGFISLTVKNRPFEHNKTFPIVLLIYIYFFIVYWVCVVNTFFDPFRFRNTEETKAN